MAPKPFAIARQREPRNFDIVPNRPLDFFFPLFATTKNRMAIEKNGG